MAAATVSACGTATVRPSSMEAAIRARFAAQGVTVHEVSCGDGTKAKVGAKVLCTARNPSDTELIITGTVTAVHGRRAQFHFAAARGIVPGRALASQVRRLLEHRVGQKAAGMSCPAHVPIPTHPSVTCLLTTRDGLVFDTHVAIDGTGRVGAEVARRPRSGG